jgi:hypothetical protein
MLLLRKNCYIAFPSWSDPTLSLVDFKSEAKLKADILSDDVRSFPSGREPFIRKPVVVRNIENGWMVFPVQPECA